ncbi:MAG: ABC transporter ATP-binding protein/permease [Treponema sp.]|nr:ABC transporter ATP-binding protein/permease [Treponema sp.]
MFETIKRIYKLCGSYKKQLVWGIVFSCIFTIFKCSEVLAILNVLTHITNLTKEVILTSLYILLGGTLGASIFKYLISMTMSANGYKVFCEKRIHIGDQLKHAPMGYFNNQNLGRISTALSTSFAELEGFSMMAVENIVRGVISSVCIIIFMFCFNWILGLISVAGLVCSSIMLKIIRKNSSKAIPRREKAKQNMISKVIEYIRGISVVKCFGGKPVNDVDAALCETRDAFIYLEMKSTKGVYTQKSILDVFGGIVLLVSALMMYYGIFDFGIGVMFIMSSFMVYSQLETMSNGAFLLNVIDHSLNEIEEILDIPTMKEGEEKISEDDSIELKNVSFGYDTRKIIDNVSFKIPKNTSTAIVGYSGSGKTTLCNLIARFWDVDRGEILFGGKNIKSYKADDLLGQMSMVFQNVYLFNDTIANNIKFGKPDASQAEIEEAAKKACCHDFIMELPDGYNTVIGEGGASLSGGERQRISIARAILKDAPIVILDEATSSVDPENEFDLLQAINALKENKTLISIAHRMTTVKNADQIIVLDQGHIAQIGTHDELIKQEGIYKRFLTVREQSVGWSL